MYFAIFLVAINAFKLLVAPHFPLIGDEAYYWLWGQHLDLSYVDHPPMIAYVNFILTSLFGPSELAVRLTAIGLVLLVSLIIYLTGRELYNKQAGELAAIIFNLVPTFFGGGMFLVPQMLLFLFWSVSFYLLVKLLKRRNALLWYPLGIAAGLGLLSDYVMALFFLATVAYLALNKKERYWFTKKEPYLAVALAALIFSPVLIWNLRLGFTPLFYWGGKMGAGPRVGDNLLNFFGLQPLLYTPPLFLLTLYLVFNKKAPQMFKLFAGVVLTPFLLISPIMNIGGHWTATTYLPAILDLPRAKRWVIVTTLLFALAVNSAAFAYYLFYYPLPAELKGKEQTINRQLPQYLKEVAPKSGRTFYLANDLGMIGLVSFHGRTKTYMAPGRLRQVDLWGAPNIRRGDNIIYFALNETTLHEKLRPLFRAVSIEPHKRLFNKDADLPNKTTIFICTGYLGGKLP
ncbi:MAG: glycosyltransferase family 39 protein [Candidatus Margulisiibacteriota bacterium]